MKSPIYYALAVPQQETCHILITQKVLDNDCIGDLYDIIYTITYSKNKDIKIVKETPRSLASQVFISNHKLKSCIIKTYSNMNDVIADYPEIITI